MAISETTTDSGTVELPTQFAENRIVVTPRLRTGEQLTLLTDSGGGLFLTVAAVQRLGFEVTQRPGPDDLEQDVATLPPFAADATIPLIEEFGRTLPVSEESLAQEGERIDGLLGQKWFAERVWTFDYPARKLLQHIGDDANLPEGQPVTLGFATDSSGRRWANFPRISVKIDGVIHDLLFDTGATVRLTDSPGPDLADAAPGCRGTCFIGHDIFNRWRRRHPDWRVIPGADANLNGAPMIEVPSVTLAGREAGPVWFVERPNWNFHHWMSQWMDRRIDGALGGSALQYFRVTVLYPRALALFSW